MDTETSLHHLDVCDFCVKPHAGQALWLRTRNHPLPSSPLVKRCPIFSHFSSFADGEPSPLHLPHSYVLSFPVLPNAAFSYYAVSMFAFTLFLPYVLAPFALFDVFEVGTIVVSSFAFVIYRQALVSFWPRQVRTLKIK